jgi:VacB/RNase II family 3'-5' exoribonuclease
MIETEHRSHRAILRDLARKAMAGRGLLADFSPEVMAEVDRLATSGIFPQSDHDLRHMLWCSIDNNSSRDLDQLTVAHHLPDGSNRIMVAVADVDDLVPRGCAIDNHARQNTTSVYTTAEVFPMLPMKLSNDLTSLNFETDRMALVIDMAISPGGQLLRSQIYRALVRNRAKLDYGSVGDWIGGTDPVPDEIGRIPGLAGNIRLQDRVARELKQYRMYQGALDFETTEYLPVFDEDRISGLQEVQHNRARDIIEEFMIVANEVTAGFLTSRHFPCFRRIVRNPRRWNRIREIASERGTNLPEEPDSRSLQEFMAAAKSEDPDGFADLSLSILKLLGPGEYFAGIPGEELPGHFGLAVRNYSHSTAPNRRYPDLITHRLLKAALNEEAMPYTAEELEELALHCTRKENDAKKVERQIDKSAVALVLESHIGQQYDAIITGAADKGTWVRIRHPHVEGRLIEGGLGLDVGHKIRVELVSVDVEEGHIDFRKVGGEE